MNWLTLAVSVVAAVLGGGGMAAIVTALARRKVTRVEAADLLNESALEFASTLKADAADARRELGEMRREMGEVRHEAEALAYELRRLRLAILDPFATLDQLRAMVSGGPGNGIPRQVVP